MSDADDNDFENGEEEDEDEDESSSEEEDEDEDVFIENGQVANNGEFQDVVDGEFSDNDDDDEEEDEDESSPSGPVDISNLVPLPPLDLGVAKVELPPINTTVTLPPLPVTVPVPAKRTKSATKTALPPLPPITGTALPPPIFNPMPSTTATLPPISTTTGVGMVIPPISDVGKAITQPKVVAVAETKPFDLQEFLKQDPNETIEMHEMRTKIFMAIQTKAKPKMPNLNDHSINILSRQIANKAKFGLSYDEGVERSISDVLAALSS